MQLLELLSPAKNLECGMAAIDHGADAVYIGAPRFGARQAAGNSVEDIQKLCDYARPFGVKVYVTVNTIIYDDELESAGRLLEQLNEAGVDAVLVQDMSLLRIYSSLSNLRFSLHASTQTDNRLPQKVQWLRNVGFRRVVLARELSADEIAEIHREVPDVELEVFVHGALCVSYSGLCYASQHCLGRSANRGECAQFCRMKFDLVDADNRIIEHQRHLLSLKDLNQSAHLEELAEAGATSFKIEGRLKGLDYVKNVTAYYSQQLNELIKKYPERYRRASRGYCRYTFVPSLAKTFNRGYTNYFLHGRASDIASFDTPKAMGEYVGTVKELRGNSFTVAGIAKFANGDGLCFLNNQHELEGFRVNRVEGNRLYPLRMPRSLRPGSRLYRNQDIEMERLLSKQSAERKIAVTMRLDASADGFVLQVGDGLKVSVKAEHQIAKTPQHDLIRCQLTKLGGTPFECTNVVLPDDFNYFIPSSQLVELRRKAVAALSSLQTKSVSNSELKNPDSVPLDDYYARVPYLYNIANRQSRQFYESCGLANPAPAYELRPVQPHLLMQCRHCLRFALGFCVKHNGRSPFWREPLRLVLSDGRRFMLDFDCRHCQMNVMSDKNG